MAGTDGAATTMLARGYPLNVSRIVKSRDAPQPAGAKRIWALAGTNKEHKAATSPSGMVKDARGTTSVFVRGPTRAILWKVLAIRGQVAREATTDMRMKIPARRPARFKAVFSPVGIGPASFRSFARSASKMAVTATKES